jgi:20S proteasome alpha/beta subunit
MTLIVGIRCSDGVVVGADGAATLGALGQTTVRQPVRKLASIDKKVIVGVSGHIGLGQRITGEVEKLWNSKLLSGKKSFDAMVIIRQAIGPHILTEIHHASEVCKLIGQPIAAQAAISFTVVGVPIEGQPRLYQFGCAGEPEEATENIPFISVGSAQSRADPFLSFVRHIFWKDSLPTVSQGIFATVWSLVHAIRVDPGGVAEPMQVMTLTTDEKRQPIVKDLGNAELDEHRQAITEVESYLSRFALSPSSKPGPEPPHI